MQRGHEKFPVLYPGLSKMKISGRHIDEVAHLIIDGRRVPGTLKIDGETVTVTPATLPSIGIHFLQVQNPGGLASNDFIFHVAKDAGNAKDLLMDAVLRGDTELVKNLVEHGANVNSTNDDGNTPLHTAAFLCRTDIVGLLVEKGGAVQAKNQNGQTPGDVVSGAWNQGLADFYTAIGNAEGLNLDLKQIERERPKLARQLRDSAKRFARR